MDRVKSYLHTLSDLISELPEEDIRSTIHLLLDAFESGKQVFIIGNGGSASTASHFACDLQKGIGSATGRAFKVMALTDNVPLMTAWANDSDYSDVFVRQLSTWVCPGDVVLGISGSGNSENIVKAIEFANGRGAITVGWSGFRGGRLAETAMHSVIVHSDDMQQIEDVHMVLAHLTFRYLMEEMAPQPSN